MSSLTYCNQCVLFYISFSPDSHGHALLAFRLSRVSAPLTPDKTVELGHHILKAHIYKSVSRQLGYSSQNIQAYWMCLSSRSLNAALVSHRNVYSPNVKVINVFFSKCVVSSVVSKYVLQYVIDKGAFVCDSKSMLEKVQWMAVA